MLRDQFLQGLYIRPDLVYCLGFECGKEKMKGMGADGEGGREGEREDHRTREERSNRE